MNQSRILLVYFRAKGITKKFYEYNYETIKLKSYQIKEKETYTQNNFENSIYDNIGCQLDQRDEKGRPETKDLSGKRIILFVISRKSGIGQLEISLNNSCPKAIQYNGIAFSQFNNKDLSQNWAKQLKF